MWASKSLTVSSWGTGSITPRSIATWIRSASSTTRLRNVSYGPACGQSHGLRVDHCDIYATIKGTNISVGPPAQAGGRKGVSVSYEAETPFDNIEGSHEYVALLAEAVEEARRDVEAELSVADRD